MPLPIKPLLLVAVLGLALASTACATPSVEKRELVGRVHVTYYDLDPQKEADARVLLGRLERAAYRACGGNPRYHRSYEIMPRYTVEVFEECRENAISCAVDSVHSVTLERLLASRRGADRPAPAKECGGLSIQGIVMIDQRNRYGTGGPRGVRDEHTHPCVGSEVLVSKRYRPE